MSAGPRTPFRNPVVEWFDSRLPIFTMMNKEYGVFPTPKNFNYFWNFGAIAMFMLVTMIVTGITLAMHYAANTGLAFDSVERIMRDVNYGWLIRYIHMNGASFFFIAVFVHIYRGMYYGSYKTPRELLWIFGVIIFLLMMATAFMGYVLPWGQMSFWGATVITNLFSALPFVGTHIVEWLWGGFSVDNPTLNRFFALHYLLPFVIVGVVFLHIWALHVTGSNNPSGIEPKTEQDTLPFHPYYTMKDSFGLVVFVALYALFIFFMPNALGHPDNYTPANPMVTPAHIVPEWYFLPFYAILRAFNFNINPYILVSLAFLVAALAPLYCSKLKLGTSAVVSLFVIGGALFMGGYLSQIDAAAGGKVLNLPFSDVSFVDAKLCGVLAMFGSIVLVALMPFLDKHPVRSARYRPQFRVALVIYVLSVFVLGKVGGMPADTPIVDLGLFTLTNTHVAQILTLYYFAFFLAILPFLSTRERALPLPDSIHDSVLACKSGKCCGE